MDNYQYRELKDAIKRIDELEEQINKLKQLMELVYDEFRKIPTYTPEFASTSKAECEKYIVKADIPK